MLKYGEEIIVDILIGVCQIAWKVDGVPDDPVPIHEREGSREIC